MPLRRVADVDFKRQVLAAAPTADVWVTQHNAITWLGMTEAAYLRRVKAWGILADRDGKLVITKLADWNRARELRLATSANDTAADDVDANLVRRYGVEAVGR